MAPARARRSQINTTNQSKSTHRPQDTARPHGFVAEAENLRLRLHPQDGLHRRIRRRAFPDDDEVISPLQPAATLIRVARSSGGRGLRRRFLLAENVISVPAFRGKVALVPVAVVPGPSLFLFAAAAATADTVAERWRFITAVRRWRRLPVAVFVRPVWFQVVGVVGGGWSSRRRTAGIWRGTFGDW